MLKLGIKDRITLLSLLPSEGNIRTLKTINALRDSLLFNETEVKRFGITQDGGQVAWTDSEETDISIGELATEVIAGKLKELDANEQLTQDHVNLWGLFVSKEASEDETP
jgi:hypothetical protein